MVLDVKKFKEFQGFQSFSNDFPGYFEIFTLESKKIKQIIPLKS
jgi:hypothetical protein